MSEDHVLGEGEHRTHKMRGSFEDSGSPQGVSTMDSQPLTHSHLGLKLLLHLGTPNISLLSVCGCRGTYNCLAAVSRQIQSCWGRHKRGTDKSPPASTQVNKPAACGRYSHFLHQETWSHSQGSERKWLPF